MVLAVVLGRCECNLANIARSCARERLKVFLSQSVDSLLFCMESDGAWVVISSSDCPEALSLAGAVVNVLTHA